MRTHRRPNGSAALLEAREIIVHPNFRRSIVAALVFVAACAAAVALGGIHATRTVTTANGLRVAEAYQAHRVGSWIAIGVSLVAGLATVRMVANEVSRIAKLRGSASAANTLRLLIQIVGYVVLAIVILGLLAVRVESVLLSGAITSVVIGLAAQQSLSNAIAGIVLLVARPFVVGDYITLRAGGLGGQYDGDVTEISLMFTKLETAEGTISFPNAAVLNAATGLRPRPSASPRE